MENFEMTKRMDSILYQLSKLYETKKDTIFHKIIVNSSYSLIEQITYNDWNGGTYGHRLILRLPESMFYEIIDKKNDYEIKIKNDLRIFTDSIDNEELVEVIFESQNDNFSENWREESGISVESNKRIVQDNAINRIWNSTNNYRLFLSHKSEFKVEASKLKNNLNKYGISSFVAHEDIEPTEEWQKEIENALFSADALLALMTDEFHVSNWTDQEIGIAIGRGIPIISIKLGTAPYGFIGKYQALKIDFDNEYCEIVGLLLKKSNRMVDVYIELVKNSSSYNESNRLAKLLQYIDSLTDSQINLLKESYENNNQVNHSNGFNGCKNHIGEYEFGKGLIFELERITGNKYVLNIKK